MLLNETEKARIKCILVASPVRKMSKKALTPCKLCSESIIKLSTAETTVLCIEFIRDDIVTFPRIDKYKPKDLHKHAYVPPVKWK